MATVTQPLPGPRLGCTPEMRHPVKPPQHRGEKSSCLRLIVATESAAVGEAEAGSAGEQPARNSQPETHRFDEPGAIARPVAPNTLTLHRFDRFPYASENSFFRYRHSARRVT